MSALVEVASVGFRYAGLERPAAPAFALEALDFEVERGEILGVIGPNSAGKTTLIRLLTKVLEPLRGEIRLDGRRLAGLTRWELARQVAVVPQDVPQGLPFTVEQMVLLGRYPHGPRRYFESAEDLTVARRAMAETGVLELAQASVERLSGGERQRAILARALAQRPRLLVLDEPTAHLDLRHQVECVTLLRRVNRREGVTILLVSHDLNLAAEISDRLLLLAEGRVVRLGSPGDVLDSSLLARVYGCPVAVDTSAGRPLVRVSWPAAEGR